MFSESVGDWPGIGPLLLSYDPIVYLSWVFVAVAAWYISRTRAGLHLRAVGHDPASADAVRLNASAVKFVHVAVWLWWLSALQKRRSQAPAALARAYFRESR